MFNSIYYLYRADKYALYERSIKRDSPCPQAYNLKKDREVMPKRHKQEGREKKGGNSIEMEAPVREKKEFSGVT